MASDRHTRRISLLSRLAEWPFDLYLLLNEMATVEGRSGGWGLGMALMAAYITTLWVDDADGDLLCQCIGYTLVGLCYLNLFWILQASRKYSIFHGRPTDIIQSPNLREYPDPDQGVVYELSVWQPPSYSLYTFCLFSPIHLAMVYLFSISLETLVALVLTSVQLLVLVRLFVQAIKDRQIVHSQVMSEYDSQFVYPRIFRAVKSQATWTEAINDAQADG